MCRPPWHSNLKGEFAIADTTKSMPLNGKISRRSFTRVVAGAAFADASAAWQALALEKNVLAEQKTSGGVPRALIRLDGSGWQLAGLMPGEGERRGIHSSPVAEGKFLNVSVPNDVQLAIPTLDPYGQGLALAEINQKEWWYVRSFVSPFFDHGQQVKLHFEGVDYFADVWLNGQKLGSHEGAYTQFAFNITERLAAGNSNYLAVRVRAPWKVPGRSHFEYMKGEFDSAWDALPGPGQVVFPLGLHRSVRLEVTGAVRIEELQVSTIRVNKQGAQIRMRVTASNAHSTRSARLQLSVRPENFSGPSVSLPPRTIAFSGAPGELKGVDLDIQVRDPMLWWTWDQGPQNLYSAEASLLDDEGRVLDELSAIFGIRTFERDANLLYRLNGRPLLVRGAWYPMSKLYPAETDAWTYEKDLLLARHANMNHLINYTVVEKREFYELADRLGILLFIELPFNQEGPLNVLNREYPRREEYIQWSAQQVAQIVRNLSNHPSVVVWSALSEVTGNGHDFATSTDPRIAAAADGYRAFSEKMQETVLANDPDGVYFRGYCDFGEHHFWEGSLFQGTTYDQQFDAKADFVSEYGALAYFPMESIRRIVDPEEIWSAKFARWSALGLPVDPKELSYLTGYSYQGLAFLTPDIVENTDRHPQDFRDFVNDSQIYQAFLYGYAGDAYRRKLFDPIHGIRSWMFKNFPLKPVSGFGVLDCFDTPMMAYYVQRRTFAPVAMSFGVRYALESIPAGGRWKAPVWISNATNSEISVRVESTLYSLQGEKLQEREEQVLVPANKARAAYDLDWDLPMRAGIYLLRGRSVKGAEILATNEMYVKVVPLPTRKWLRVLIVGTADWAQPVINYLSNLGAEVTLVLHPSGSVLNAAGHFPDSAGDLLQQYDVIWLTGFDSYWREAPESWAPVIVQAVEAGVAFVHTGSWASFHGGEDDKTAALDLTPLAQVLPVAVRHTNDVWDGQIAGLPGWSAASSTKPKIEVSGGAPDWLKQADFEGLYPPNYHVLDPRPEATMLLSVNSHPLLVMGHYGRGRTIAYLGFSPAGDGSTQVVIDRDTRTSEGRLFFMVAATSLALASGESLAAPMADLIETRATPIFETLRNLPAGPWPDISLSWLEISKKSTKAQIRIKNGPGYLRGLRLRFDGPDFTDGSVLPLWSNQFFDLLPREEVKCTVELIAKSDRPLRGFSIVGETLKSPRTKAYVVPLP